MRKERSSGSKPPGGGRSVPSSGFSLMGCLAIPLWLLTVAPAPGVDDPGARAVQQQQLQRQQQQEALQLRLQQQQRAVQPAPGAGRQPQATGASAAERRQQLDQLHYRQETRPATAQPTDDDAERRARTEMERIRAQEESRRERERLNAGEATARPR
jgi:hypothetical protein